MSGGFVQPVGDLGRWVVCEREIPPVSGGFGRGDGLGESVFIQSVREFGRGVGEFGRGVGKFRRRWGIWAEIGGLGQRWVWVWIGEFGRRQGFWMLRGWGGLGADTGIRAWIGE